MRVTARLFLLPLLLAASPVLAGPEAAAIDAAGQGLRYPAAKRLDLRSEERRVGKECRL